MKSNSLLMSFVIAVILLALPPQLRAQPAARQQNNALARVLFLEGVDFFDEGKFVDAEKKFREALTKYSNAEGSDRTSFYLISTLIKLGRTGEARSEILNFNKNYPQSRWKTDVEEKRLYLDGVLPTARIRIVVPAFPQRPAMPPPQPFGVAVGSAPNPSLDQEYLRIIVQTDPDQGIEVARERLKANPSDPAVVSNFVWIAHSGSPQAFPFFVNAGSGPNPNTQKQAVYWIGRLNNEKDAVGKGFVEMVKEKTAIPAVTNVLSRDMNVTRAVLYQVVQHPSIEKLYGLERIFNNTAAHPLRMEILESAGSMPDAAAREFLTGVAKNEGNLSVRLLAVHTLAMRTDVDGTTLEEIMRTLANTMAPAPGRRGARGRE